MEKNQPPIPLIKTWIALARQNDHPDAKLRALQMLRDKVGTPEEIAKLLKQLNM
ncbi:hypothetical protein [Thalassotalea piscium]|uniref:HEAT repeat domain-containing protein n=1 Tax=Thalassotalea piscium TaxID=1230533 RepID=A0A7X0NGR3_9GAMM|nr:hypothetical protein [Thalassotalea piscium]MBB6543138.1 hypothetical protein [Thalassotalea piscium]